MVLLPPMVWL